MEARAPPRCWPDVDGILVPGGFGERGTEGKIAAVRYARENKVPFFGICLGMQMAVIEFAPHRAGPRGRQLARSSTSTRRTRWSTLMDEQVDVADKGGTMRLGGYPCALKPGTLAARALRRSDVIQERHRHRYEVNNAYREQLDEARAASSPAINPDAGPGGDDRAARTTRCFVGCQFHPEFKSQALRAAPALRRLHQGGARPRACASRRQPLIAGAARP